MGPGGAQTHGFGQIISKWSSRIPRSHRSGTCPQVSLLKRRTKVGFATTKKGVHTAPDVCHSGPQLCCGRTVTLMEDRPQYGIDR